MNTSTLQSIRQLFQACADDTRLRILAALQDKELSVNRLCELLGVSQPAVSRHLARLRLSRMVVDRREGNLVYYGLNKTDSTPQHKIISFILSEFHAIPAFMKDKQALRRERKR